MPFLNFNSSRPAIKLVIILLSIITIGIIVFFFGVLFGKLFIWVELKDVDNVLYGRYELLTDWQLKYFQLIQTLSFFLIPGIFLHWIFSTPKISYFETRKAPKIGTIVLVLIAFVVGMPLLNWIIEFNQNINFPSGLRNFELKLHDIEESYAGITERLLISQNPGQYIFNIIMIAVLPAIGEEFIFRGAFQKIFTEIGRNIHLSILITALIFSLVHGQFYGLIPRFVLGVFFGYLMVWSKTIWLPVIAHFINNAIAVSFYHFSNGAGSPQSFKLMNSPGLITVLISLFLLSLVLYAIRKIEFKNT